MSSTSRSLQRNWTTAYETAPPAACSTLRNYNNVVEWGYTCAFAEEEDDSAPTPFSIRTECMPWVTPNTYPASNAFYSPATACPNAWTAVATRTSGVGDQWIDGETALMCCPSGFEGDGNQGCRPGSAGIWPVVECGEADAEENESKTYSGAAWPASATPSITALQLRYQATDIESLSPSSTNGSTGTRQHAGSGIGGLTTAEKAAIGTVIPIVVLIIALACFLLWRRKRAHTKVRAETANDDANDGQPSTLEVAYNKASGLGITGAASHITAHKTTGAPEHQFETPEWNVEMDARETERYRAYRPPTPELSFGGNQAQHLRRGDMIQSVNNLSELAGLARKPRKPLPAYEIDGVEKKAELSSGDAGNADVNRSLST